MTAALKARRTAESEVARLERAVASWQDDAERTAMELTALEASAGALMDAEDPRAAAREMAGKAMELRFLIDGARGAAETSRRQLRDAREELALAQAAEKRQEAAKLTAEAEALQGKVDDLLRQLTELDGATYVPEPELFGPEREAAVGRGGYVLPVQPRAYVLQDQAATLVAEAEALEAPVLEERRAREAAARPLVASADIQVPAWDDLDGDSQVSCRVSEGAGSATFEVSVSGQSGGNWTVRLPDEQGRRIWGKRVKLQAGGGQAVIRCNGEVLAKETRPGRLMNDGFARWWVEP